METDEFIFFPRKIVRRIISNLTKYLNESNELMHKKLKQNTDFNINSPR